MQTMGCMELFLNVGVKGQYILIKKDFCLVYDYVAYWNPKRNLGVTKHFFIFLEIIKQQ